MNIFVFQKEFQENNEFVERKGIGHPDTLADALAEELSMKYSNYTLRNFGVVLHHNFDKVGLLGGSSYVSFGRGYLKNPIKVLINGRASIKFGKKEIPINKLLIGWAKNFFKKRLPMINVSKDLKLYLNLSSQSSPGKTYEKEAEKGARRRWFEPESIKDIPELKKLFANDTVLGVGYAPFSKLEKLIINIERFLNSKSYKEKNPWIGSDIKIMGFRNTDAFFLTLCIPQVANFVKTLKDYKVNIKKLRHDIERTIKKHDIENYKLEINTRDNYKLRELYLTAIGSSIESGDEGLAGRGNRVNGLISSTKPISIEGSCGKNPVYHVGKLYYLAAFEIADKVFKKFKTSNEIFIASQSGRDLMDPWIVAINIPKGFSKKEELENFVKDEIKKIPMITKKVLNRKIMLF